MEEKHVAPLPAKATPEFIEQYAKVKRSCYFVLHRVRGGNPDEYNFMFDDYYGREHYEEKLAEQRPHWEIVYYEHVTDINFGWNEFADFEYFLIFELSEAHRPDDIRPQEWLFTMRDISNPMQWITLYWQYKEQKDLATHEAFFGESRKEQEQLKLF